MGTPPSQTRVGISRMPPTPTAPMKNPTARAIAASASHSPKITPASQAQRPPVAGQFQIAKTQYLAAALGRHRAFPVNGAGSRARVEFLVCLLYTSPSP